MSKLTKEEIKFIENYLCKSNIKNWDVRVEVLDHIVTSVESKIEEKGVSFNEALLEAHQDFGNKISYYGASHKKYFETLLYQNQSGFKAFALKKNKETQRKYWRHIWNNMKQILTSPLFLVEYAAVLLLLFTMFQYSEKTAAVGGYLVVIIPYMFITFYSLKDKSIRKSLHLSLLSNIGFLFFSLYNLGVQVLLPLFYEKGEPKPYMMFALILAFMYPFSRAQVNIYLKEVKKYKALYELQYSK